MADHLGSGTAAQRWSQGCCGFESHLSYWQTKSSSWSSLECSPPCHGGDRGFKSRRGRLEHGAVRKPAKRPSSNLGDLRVRLPPAPLKRRVGWASASSSGCNPPAFGLCRFDSCPAHWKLGPFVYRFRTPAPQAGRAGSIPARATWPSGAIGRHATLRTSAPRGRGSSSLPLATSTI
jgi:hypothetical protein